MDGTMLLVGGGALALVTVAVAGKALFGRRAPTTQSDAKVKELVAKGSYEAAAERASELGDLESAYELYLRANKLQMAANVAKKLGKQNVAAELMETSRELGEPPPKAPSMRPQEAKDAKDAKDAKEPPSSAPVSAAPSPLPPPTPKSQSIRPEIPSSHPAPSRPPSTPPPPSAPPLPSTRAVAPPAPSASPPRAPSVRPPSISPPSAPPVSASPTSGMSVDELRAMIGGREADLANIEVYFRLGVALQEAASWDDAMRAFATVEEVSPGYRDAQKRLEEIVRAQGGTPELPPSQRTDMPPPMRSQQRTMMGVAPSVVLGPSPPRELPIPSPPPPPAKSDS